MSCSREVAWVRMVLRFARIFCSLVSSSCSRLASARCSFSCSSSSSFSVLVGDKTARCWLQFTLGQAPPPGFTLSESPRPSGLHRPLPPSSDSPQGLVVLLQILEVLLQLGQQGAQLRCLLCPLPLLAALLSQHEDNLWRWAGVTGSLWDPAHPNSILKIQLRTCSHVQAGHS